MIPLRGEFGWIERLSEILAAAGALGPEVAGRAALGDDATVLEGPAGQPWAWTVDTLVEGVHFRFDWLDEEAVGHRALAASLSDLAATGAEPAGALVSAAVSAAGVGRLEGIYRGLAVLAARAGCPVVGGDLARSEGSLHLTVTALGRVTGGPPLGRSGARAGDELWVTGRLGGPAAAVALLDAASGSGGDPRGAVANRPAYDRFARPSPRGPEIAWLRGRAALAAAIDLSDGLSGDAAHLARRSGVAVVLDAAAVPALEDAVAAARELDVDPAEWPLHGGEEFELLLAARPGSLAPLAAEFEAVHGVPLSRVGDVEEGAGVHLRDSAGVRPLEPRSWNHFAEADPTALAPPDAPA